MFTACAGAGLISLGCIITCGVGVVRLGSWDIKEDGVLTRPVCCGRITGLCESTTDEVPMMGAVMEAGAVMETGAVMEAGAVMETGAVMDVGAVTDVRSTLSW